MCLPAEILVRLGHGGAVFAGVAGAVVYFLRGVVDDGLAAAHGGGEAGFELDVVAAVA